MSQSTLSRELALAIGLAAKALPGMQLKLLVTSLVKALGLPLTKAKLNSLTYDQYRLVLKKANCGTFNQAALKSSLAELQFSKLTPKEKASSVEQSASASQVPHSLRIAIASKSGEFIDDQFSVCKYFYIYQVSGQVRDLFVVRSTETDETLKAEEKQFYRAQLIQDCQVLYCDSIGGAAASKVIKYGVHPVKLSGSPPIDAILKELQHVLVTAPPPWLAKSIGLPANSPNQVLQEEMI